PRDVRVTAQVEKSREEETRETPPSPPADAEGDAEDRHAEADKQFDDHFWPAYPARDGKKLGEEDARARWRNLTIEQRRRALKGARNYALSDEKPRDAKRFLTKSRAGAWPFDDWQTPPDPTSRTSPRDRPMTLTADGREIG